MWRVLQAAVGDTVLASRGWRVNPPPVAIHRVRPHPDGRSAVPRNLRMALWRADRSIHARIELAARLQHVTDGRGCDTPPPAPFPLGPVRQHHGGSFQS